MVPVTPEKDLPRGWLTLDEAEALSTLAAHKNVLELGAYKGRSTVVLAQVAEYVVSVDRHRGIEPHHTGDTLSDYMDATRDLENVAKVVVEDWSGFIPLLSDKGFDLVYIDGDHDRGSVERDIALAVWLEPNQIAFHDFDFDQVAAAARAMLGKPTGLVGSLAWYKR